MSDRRPLIPILFALLLATFLAPSTPSPAQDIDLDAPIPFDPRTRLGTLDNGIRYYIRENPEPQDRAELRLVVNAGSILEDEDQQGLAHFLEHMAFNGTKNFEHQELVSYLESIGMQFGPDINAYTSFDETVYMLTVPTDEEEILAKAFLVLEDWAHGHIFDPEEVDKERGVVIEEWRLRRGARQRIADKQYPILFHESRYAERLPIGKKDILENFDHAVLKRFFEDWYRPDLMAVVAVGDFDADAVQKLIETHFAGIAPVENPRERAEYDVPEHEETLFAIATDEEATMTLVAIENKGPSRTMKTIGDFRQAMLERIYNGMLNARLRELTQQADPPFVNAFAGLRGRVRPLESYTVGAMVEENGLERGLETVLLETRRVAQHGFTASELERGKKSILSSVEAQYKEREKTNSSAYASNRVSAFLDGSAAPGTEWNYHTTNAIMPGITLEEINALAGTWTSESNRVITFSGPEKDDLAPPTEAELLAVIQRAAATDVEPYEDKVTDAPLVAEERVPGRVVEESYDKDLDLHLWTLSNGVRVYLKSTDFKDDEIMVHSYSPGGSSLADEDWYLSAELASFIVGSSGLGAFGPIELNKHLAGKQLRADVFVGSMSEGISGGSTPQDVETLFDLMYLQFTAPRRDETVFASLKTRVAAMLANREVDPGRAFSDSLNLTLAQYHPRAMPLTVERLDEIDLDHAYSFYQDRFADASDFTFAIVGAFELDEMRPLVERTLGALPDLDREEEGRDLEMLSPTGVIRKSFERGIEDKGRTEIVFTGDFEWNRAQRHALSSLTDALRIELRDVLREDLGGTYGVNISSSRARDPRPEFAVHIGFGCDPERVEELSGEVFKVIERIQDEGISQETIDKVKEGQRRQVEEGKRQNDSWLSQILFRAQYDIDQREYLNTNEVIDALTPEIVQAASRRYLPADNFVQVTMLPEGFSERDTSDTPAEDDPGR